MAKWLSNIFELVSNQLVLEEESAPEGKSPDIVYCVERARKDWLTARAYFDNVTDPDLIDHAIFWIEAAEKKYMYLLKQAKALGIRFNFGQHDEQMMMEAPKSRH